MYKVNTKELENELKEKEKILLIEFLIALIVNIVLAVVYFIITKKNYTYGQISILLSILTIITLISTIKNIFDLNKCKRNAKILSKKGILIKNQIVRVDIFFLSNKSYIYFIDRKMKIHKLRIRHQINYKGESKVDLLIDKDNPNIYFIDKKIDTTNEYDKKKNLESFSKDKYYPDYCSYYTSKKENYRNILVFTLGIIIGVILFIIKKEDIIKVASIILIISMLVNIIKGIINIVNNNSIINKIIYLSNKGTLIKDNEYSKEFINNKVDIIPKIKYKDKELIGDIIKYQDNKKIDLLIDEKKKIYHMNYNIMSYYDKYNQ